MGSPSTCDGIRFNHGRARLRRAYSLFMLAIFIAGPFVIYLSGRYWPPLVIVLAVGSLAFILWLVLASRRHDQRRYGYWIPVVEGELWPIVAVFGGVMVFLPLGLSEFALLESRPVLSLLSELSLQLVLVEAVCAMAIFTFFMSRRNERLSHESVQFRFTRADLEGVAGALKDVFETLRVPYSENPSATVKGASHFAITDGGYQIKVGPAPRSGVVIIRGMPKSSQHFYSSEVDGAIDLSLSTLDALSKTRKKRFRIPA